MNRTRNLEACAFLLILCLASSPRIVHAVAVGVQPGDWIKYNITGPSDVPGQTENYWSNITVNSVSGTLISITMETNSTTLGTRNYQIDIAFDCWIGGAWPYIVPASLSAGDNIPGNVIITISDTTQHLGRDTAHFAFNSQDETSDWYWDRQKGVLMEMSGIYQNQPMAYRMDSTNMWSSTSNFLGLGWQVWAIIGIIAAVAVAVSVFAFVRHKGKPPTTLPTPQFQPPPPPPPPP